MSSEHDDETTMKVGDVEGNVVQSRNIDNVTVNNRDRRTVILLALVLVVVLAAAAVIVWLVREPELEGDPLAADTSVGVLCGTSSGWVVPDQRQSSVPYVSVRPPNAVLGTGGVVTTTLQGLAPAAVVLQSARVEVLKRRPAVPGILLTPRCASEVKPRHFAVDLSAASPTVTPAKGVQGAQVQEFPFKVDPTDVEQLVVRADSPKEDVEWVLWVKWSSGRSSGEFRIPDGDKSFRTTAITAAKEWCVDEIKNQWMSCA